MVYTDRYSFAQPNEKPRRATAFEPKVWGRYKCFYQFKYFHDPSSRYCSLSNLTFSHLFPCCFLVTRYLPSPLPLLLERYLVKAWPTRHNDKFAGDIPVKFRFSNKRLDDAGMFSSLFLLPWIWMWCPDRQRPSCPYRTMSMSEEGNALKMAELMREREVPGYYSAIPPTASFQNAPRSILKWHRGSEPWTYTETKQTPELQGEYK